MSNITSSRDRFFISAGLGYDLECLAEGLTRESWEEEAKTMAMTESLPLAEALQLGVMVTTKLEAPNKGPCKLSPKEARIAAIFGGTAVDKNAMKLRVAMTLYFRRTDRPLLPEMLELVDEGMTAFLNDGKPWGLPNKKPSTDHHQLCIVIAIDKKFPKKRKSIGKALGISAEGVRQQIRRAMNDEEKIIDASLFEESLPENLNDCLELLRDIRMQMDFVGWVIYKQDEGMN